MQLQLFNAPPRPSNPKLDWISIDLSTQGSLMFAIFFLFQSNAAGRAIDAITARRKNFISWTVDKRSKEETRAIELKQIGSICRMPLHTLVDLGGGAMKHNEMHPT